MGDILIRFKGKGGTVDDTPKMMTSVGDALDKQKIAYVESTDKKTLIAKDTATAPVQNALRSANGITPDQRKRILVITT